MRLSRPFKALLSALLAVTATGSSVAPSQNESSTHAMNQACPNDDSGLNLPPRFLCDGLR